MPKIFWKWPLSWKMFHIIYQHSWAFNLETLLMLGIFSKWPLDWNMLSTIYQYSRQVDLVGNCHNFILKLKKSQLKHSCKCHVIEKFWLKKVGFLLLIQVLKLDILYYFKIIIKYLKLLIVGTCGKTSFIPIFHQKVTSICMC
jgi:hypothetical protein